MIIADPDAPICGLPENESDKGRWPGPSDNQTPGSRDRVSCPTTSCDHPSGEGTSPLAGGDSDFSAVLLAMASHDLRQPLQVIVGAQELLAERLSGDGPEQAALARIGRASAQLADCLSMLVDALYLRHGAGRDHLGPVWLDNILSALVVDHAEWVRARRVEFRVLPGRAHVLSNPVLLGGILRNLMRNAVGYTPPGGRVLISCRHRGPAVHIEVRDNGVGIPAEAHAEVFRPFYRADATRRNGVGLGLFIVKHAAEVCGHRIELYSAPGRGSRFVVIAESAGPQRRRCSVSPREESS